MSRVTGSKSSDNQEDHSQRAYKGIRKMLYSRELTPGQKLSIREVAGRLDMSLTPVIQALKYLEYQSFVRHEPNRGYSITPFSLEEVEEIYDLRHLIEPGLIPHSILRLDGAGRLQLKDALESHRAAQREDFTQDRIFKNVRFHLTLASLSKNETHMRVLRNLFDLLVLKYGSPHGSAQAMLSVDQEHQRIFDFVVSGNVAEAQTVLRQHIISVKAQVIEKFRLIHENRDLPEF